MSYIPSNGIYNATPPTLSDGETYPPALDGNGKLLISPTITLSSNVGPNTYAIDQSPMPATPNVFPMAGEYNSVSTTYADGDASVFQQDISGFLKSREQYIPSFEDNVANVAAIYPQPPQGNFSNYGWSIAGGFTGTTYQTTKASAGIIQRISVSNLNAAIRYILLYNQATATPSGSTNLIGTGLPIPIGAGSTISAAIFEIPGTYLGSTGITIAVSTSPTTFTAATAADHALMVWFK